ncbi:MAG: ABC transporter permease [Acidobacteria bacterium]|nr:MAG: ABC transporter permease [Acidobacteriota bacterium]
MKARELLSRGGPFLGLVLVSALFGGLVGPQFFTPGNLELIARQTAIVGMAALGMTLVIASAGIDLSVGSVISLSTVVVALLLRHAASPALAALAAVAAAAVCGLVTGLLVTGLRVVPFIVTLGMMLLVRGAAKGLAEERRIEAPVTWLNDLLRTHAAGVGVLLPTGIWVLLAMALLVAGVLRYTRFGRHLLAIGSNERTARLCGVRVGRCTVAVYAIEAALTGLAGVMQFAKLSVGDPTVAVGLELDVIAAVIIGGGSLTGGRGTVFGTLVGAVLMTVIQIGCSQRGLPNWVQQIVTGGVIVAAVAIDHWRQRAQAA